ncbi:hypothetical protein BT69DRAFT_1284887 [Atractiella rhizophila]|nr:hypothetical protein BT69DRAFT_1290920 [Atractiella rhizophila]KAH8919366.1 hypothetical protein BT69DRAFT_1284887 [Atractiella rhizophila]
MSVLRDAHYHSSYESERCKLTMGTLLSRGQRSGSSRPLLLQPAQRPNAIWRNEITSRTFQRVLSLWSVVVTSSRSAASFCRDGSKWNGLGSFLI